MVLCHIQPNRNNQGNNTENKYSDYDRKHKKTALLIANEFNYEMEKLKNGTRDKYHT